MNDSEIKEKLLKVCDNKSVGMIIRKGETILLIERKKPPYGFAPPAGHVDDKGSFDNAAKEEVEEEVGLNVVNVTLVTEGRKENPCRRPGGSWHYWKIYEVETSGEVKRSEDETKQAGWYTVDQIKTLAQRTVSYKAGEISEDDWQNSPGIEPVWCEWFKELKIL